MGGPLRRVPAVGHGGRGGRTHGNQPLRRTASRPAPIAPRGRSPRSTPATRRAARPASASSTACSAAASCPARRSCSRGEPGVGKSTLLLEVAAQSARAGRRVLYASAEESTAQVRLRAERTGALHDELYIAAETDLATILGHVDEVRPELLIVDSVQTVSSVALGGHGRAPEPGARGRLHPHPRREGPRTAGHHRRPRDEGRLDRRARASSSTSSTWCASSRATGRRRCASSAP